MAKKTEQNSSWADLAKKVVYASIGSAAMAKNIVSDSTISKTMINGLLSKAEQRKDELIAILAGEVSKFLGKINVGEELTKALKGLMININASIDFSEKKSSIHKSSVKKKN